MITGRLRRLREHKQDDRVDTYAIVAGNEISMSINFEHNGKLVHVNKGTKRDESDGQESGFTLCSACNRWLFGEDALEDHISRDKKKSRCPKNATDDKIIRQIVLFTDERHDVITIDIPKPENILDEQQPNFLSTVKESLLKGIEITLNLDEGEISGFVLNMDSDERKKEIIIYETAEGGVGYLQTIFNKNRFEQIISTTLELLHENDQDKGCLKACYECLLNFYNQREHENFDRRLAVPFLRKIQSVEIRKDIQPDSESISKSLLEKCASEFEKEVLYEIHRRRLVLPDEANKTIFDKNTPIAQADFFFAKKNIVLFIDGGPHGKDYVIKADEKKRRELMNLGYRVHSIHYSRAEEDMQKLSIVLER